jgi:ABC-type glutathione transport system ATPase component
MAGGSLRTPRLPTDGQTLQLPHQWCVMVHRSEMRRNDGAGTDARRPYEQDLSRAGARTRHPGRGKNLVRHRHREVKAVQDPCFTVQAGELVGLIGPNGAGKTTTPKILSGLLYPTTRKARVLGCMP